MRILIVKQTTYNDVTYIVGKKYMVDRSLATRWVNAGIAEYADLTSSPKKPEIHDADDVEEVKDDSPKPDDDSTGKGKNTKKGGK